MVVHDGEALCRDALQEVFRYLLIISGTRLDEDNVLVRGGGLDIDSLPAQRHVGGRVGFGCCGCSEVSYLYSYRY